MYERVVGGKKAIKVMRKERQGAPLEEGLRDHLTRHNKENEWKMVLGVSVLLSTHCLGVPVMVFSSTLLYYISLLSGYRNIDNQCKDPMDNDKDCGVG